MTSGPVREDSSTTGQPGTPPVSITGGPGAVGPSCAIPGSPSGAYFFVAVTSVFAFSALGQLLELDLAGFAVFTALGTGVGWVAWLMFSQSRRRPTVFAGPGGVWLADQGVRPGEAIVWDDIDELVLFRVTERQVFRSATRHTRKPALGVRLRVPASVPEDEQRTLERLFGHLPDEYAAMAASAAAMLAMPYRIIGAATDTHRAGLTAVAKAYAPQVRVVDGPPALYRYAWRPGHGDSVRD